MDAVLTLIADPAARNLSTTEVGIGRDALANEGADVGVPDWLETAIACDVPFGGLPPAEAERTARAALADRPIDLAAQWAGKRRKGLLVADMESTIIAQEMLDEIAVHAGLGPGIAEVTARAMAGELEFEAALEARVDLLAGLPEALLDELAGIMTPNPGARSLVASMRAKGAYCALLSGGFDCFTAKIAALCGFDEERANQLLVAEGRLTGKVARPILGREAKLTAMEELCARLGLSTAEACAVGDGANDLDMVAAAGLGVAYHGKEVLRSGAGARVDHSDLTALLYIQGYRGDEVIRPC